MSSKPEVSEKELFSLINRVLQDEPIAETDTFLSVINRKSREVYLSALLAYAFKNSADIIQTLCEEYAKEKNKQKNMDTFDFASANIRLEQGMDGKRADIFIEIPEFTNKTDEKNEYPKTVATVTIENKTDTGEHGEQTSYYRSYVEENYPDPCFNCFFFLRPYYNHNDARDPEYFNIWYSDIKKWLGYSENYIINDLKNHIELYLEETKVGFTDSEKEIIGNIGNYSGIKKIIKSIDVKIQNQKSKLLAEVEKRLKDNYAIEIANEKNSKNDGVLKEVKEDNGSINSYRLYRRKWFNWEEKGESYYFYVEIRFFNESNGPFQIKFQQTVKDYKSSRNKQDLLMSFLRNKYSDNKTYGNYHVLNHSDFFKSEYDLFTDKWENEFVEKAAESLKKLIEQMDQTFADFEKHKAEFTA